MKAEIHQYWIAFSQFSRNSFSNASGFSNNNEKKVSCETLSVVEKVAQHRTKTTKNPHTSRLNTASFGGKRRKNTNIRRKSESKKRVVCVNVLLLRSDAHSMLKNLVVVYERGREGKNLCFRAHSWNIVKFFSLRLFLLLLSLASVVVVVAFSESNEKKKWKFVKSEEKKKKKN